MNNLQAKYSRIPGKTDHLFSDGLERLVALNCRGLTTLANGASISKRGL
ncbi:MAG: hypothetical protein ACRDRL_25845 [Sciscionella sp.]